jgi:hypothetical protein
LGIEPCDVEEPVFEGVSSAQQWPMANGQCQVAGFSIHLVMLMLVELLWFGFARAVANKL